MIHILRHGQSLHNIDRNYSHPDPPLTQLGHQQASNTHTPKPDLILVSPMTRTVQTALIVFDQLLNTSPPKVELQIWPDLREAHDAICNKGVSRVAMAAKFPQFDFAACSEEWDYAPHTVDDAIARAEGVRRRLKHFSLTYKNIMLVTHRGFAAFLVKGMRFDVCECRSYRFAADEEIEKKRRGINCDTLQEQDFGPSLLLLSRLSLHGVDNKETEAPQIMAVDKF